MNPFEQLQNVVIEPRQVFEEIATRIIELTQGGTRRIRVYGGDGGVDSFRGEYGRAGEVDVWQVKYFPTVWTDSQKQQIRDSFERARTNPDFRLRLWFLVVPTRLVAKDVLYFHEWANQFDPKSTLIDGDQLGEMLAKDECAPVRQQLAKLGVVGLVVSGLRFSAAVTVQNPGPNSGRVCNLYVHLKNEADISATNLRVEVAHSETGCIAGAINGEWWANSSASGVLNPRPLRALYPVNPDTSVIVMEVPLVERSNFPAWVELTIGAQDTKPVVFHAVLAREVLTFGRNVQMDAGRVDTTPQKPVPHQPCTEGGVALLGEILKNKDADDRGISYLIDGMPGDPLLVSFSASMSRTAEMKGMRKRPFREGLDELVDLGLLELEGEGDSWIIFRYMRASEQ